MKPLRTQSFKLGRYRIVETDGAYGWCDIPGDDGLTMNILKGNTLKALQTAIHEAAHAEAVPSKYLDGDRDFTEHIGKMLWRMGWRREDVSTAGTAGS